MGTTRLKTVLTVCHMIFSMSLKGAVGAGRAQAAFGATSAEVWVVKVAPLGLSREDVHLMLFGDSGVAVGCQLF